METIEYTGVINRTNWPAGPWDSEPQDKVQWQDAATGLPCMVKRNHFGAWCGYVGVEEGHPAYEADEFTLDVNVHGCLTFGGMCSSGPEPSSICHVPAPGEPDRVYWLGFDCGHLGDVMPNDPMRQADDLRDSNYERDPWPSSYRSLAYVKEECLSLAYQLSQMK